jgi:hypothetical protein
VYCVFASRREFTHVSDHVGRIASLETGLELQVADALDID